MQRSGRVFLGAVIVCILIALVIVLAGIVTESSCKARARSALMMPIPASIARGEAAITLQGVGSPTEATRKVVKALEENGWQVLDWELTDYGGSIFALRGRWKLDVKVQQDPENSDLVLVIARAKLLSYEEPEVEE